MTAAPDKSSERDLLVQRLYEDLLGPRRNEETLSDRPSDVYLTGILWPQRTSMSGEDDDTLATGGITGSGDDATTEAEGVPTNSIQKPCVAGISFCAVGGDAPRADVRIQFGRYSVQEVDDHKSWTRYQVQVELKAFDLSGANRYLDLSKIDPTAAGAQLHIRSIPADGRSLITISLINATPPGEGRDELEMASMFQTLLHIAPSKGTILVPKPARAVDPADQGDDDERSNTLLFRDVHEFASGHVCSASWGPVRSAPGGMPSADWIATSWLPSAIVPGVNPDGHEFFSSLGKGSDFNPLSALSLASATSPVLRSGLKAVCRCYSEWLNAQELQFKELSAGHSVTARFNLKQCAVVLARMERAADEICGDASLMRAFQLSNLAMHTQHQWDPEKSRHGPLRWRPFQLGFLLLSGVSAAQSDHTDREVMDLLWFPTGGGKTEAYLALIAMVAFYRRLPQNGMEPRLGVAALMRYTLRLLTTQQFARSAAMILACEAIRSKRVQSPEGPALKGDLPFSIGLWVGGDATPNTRANAYASLQGSREVASPQQLALCPACQAKLRWTQTSVASPVVPRCETKGCVLEGPLPVWTVDEDVYDEHPTLLVGTVDKFAQIVRRAETNALFGIGGANPPDLIIQDELHLISGPLGTVAGAYEAAFDILFSKDGRYPKVIGSTATIRRAAEQVRDLFDRTACQFPPPAINHDDSGFAVLNPKSSGRRYVGVTTSGRSAKFTLQAVAASLLQSAAGAFCDDRVRDPYWTLIGYFNSLRELGGALVLMQDDVSDSIRLYSAARGESATTRTMNNVEELTSRRTQEEILEMLGRLAIQAGQPGALDTVLATNMVSVGVDIPRLGLMVVNGQPKAIAEYIQATSRVGRGSVSGLVVSVLNNAKARDRSRFETFSGWHQTLYRDVEATSVTPFASRARDRALHAALVAAVRHIAPGMLQNPVLDASAISKAEELIDLIVERAGRIDPEETAVRFELEKKLDQWVARGPAHYWQDYKESSSLLLSAERAAWKKALGKRLGAAWPTLNSMRTVEAGTPFRLAPVLKDKGDSHGE